MRAAHYQSPYAWRGDDYLAWVKEQDNWKREYVANWRNECMGNLGNNYSWGSDYTWDKGSWYTVTSGSTATVTTPMPEPVTPARPPSEVDLLRSRIAEVCTRGRQALEAA